MREVDCVNELNRLYSTQRATLDSVQSTPCNENFGEWFGILEFLCISIKKEIILSWYRNIVRACEHFYYPQKKKALDQGLNP